MNGSRRRVTAAAVAVAAVLGVLTGAVIALATSRTDATLPVTADEVATTRPSRSAPPTTSEPSPKPTATPGATPSSDPTTRAASTSAPAPPPSTTPPPSPVTSSPAPRTDVPDSVLLTEQDLGLVRLAADDPASQGGIETLTKCLLGSDDLVGIASATFGVTDTGDAAAYVGVISQESSAEAARQLDGFHDDMRSCEANLREWSANPELSVDVRPVDGGPDATDLGTGAWAYRVEVEDFASVVVGFRQANTTSVLAFSTEEFTAQEALEHAGTVHERVTEVFGV